MEKLLSPFNCKVNDFCASLDSRSFALIHKGDGTEESRIHFKLADKYRASFFVNVTMDLSETGQYVITGKDLDDLGKAVNETVHKNGTDEIDWEFIRGIGYCGWEFVREKLGFSVWDIFQMDSELKTILLNYNLDYALIIDGIIIYDTETEVIKCLDLEVHAALLLHIKVRNIPKVMVIEFTTPEDVTHTIDLSYLDFELEMKSLFDAEIHAAFPQLEGLSHAIPYEPSHLERLFAGSSLLDGDMIDTVMAIYTPLLKSSQDNGLLQDIIIVTGTMEGFFNATGSPQSLEQRILEEGFPFILDNIYIGTYQVTNGQIYGIIPVSGPLNLDGIYTLFLPSEIVDHLEDNSVLDRVVPRLKNIVPVIDDVDEAMNEFMSISEYRDEVVKQIKGATDDPSDPGSPDVPSNDSGDGGKNGKVDNQGAIVLVIGIVAIAAIAAIMTVVLYREEGRKE